MPLKDWSTTAGSNTASPPNGAPEGMTIANVNNVMRQVMADVRTLAAADTIASATTCDLGTKDATFLTVSGTTTITGLGTVSAGIYKFVVFSGALTLTHNGTSLILPGAANITTVAGDTALFLSLGSGNWRCMYYQAVTATSYQPLDSDLTAIAALTTTATGRSLLAIADAAAGRTILSAQETLVSATNIKTINSTSLLGSGDISTTPAALSTASGSAPSYSARAWVNFNGTGTVAINSSGNVSSITDNDTGDYTINFTTAMPDANYSVQLSALARTATDIRNTVNVAGDLSTGATTMTANAVRIVNGKTDATGFQDSALILAAIFR